jgi:hypothetical protein
MRSPPLLPAEQLGMGEIAANRDSAVAEKLPLAKALQPDELLTRMDVLA